MDRCVFCDAELAPGSQEHVFLSALGGRVVTGRALCLGCNNAFASNETGRADDALADAFRIVRNGLKIWSGRKGPPPTIVRAGTLPNGVEFDLAPGYVPIVRAGVIPLLIHGQETALFARDENDVKRQLDIIGKRGFNAQFTQARRIQEKAPTVHQHVDFGDPRLWRSLTKTAITAFVIFHGNEQARRRIAIGVLQAVRYGTPALKLFSGWDYRNEWPGFTVVRPHEKTPGAIRSGFEHSIVIADVGALLIAYLTLFGRFRFTVALGARSGLPTRGLAINPRASTPSRFEIEATAPKQYVPAEPGPRSRELDRDGLLAAVNEAVAQAQQEARAEAVESIADELIDQLETAGQDELQRASVVRTFAARVALVELGGSWATDLDARFDEDSGMLVSLTDSSASSPALTD